MEKADGGKARGRTGRDFFAQVEHMVAEQTLSRSEAFRLAQKAGRRGAARRALLALRQVVEFVEQWEAELEQLRKARARHLTIRRLVA